MKREPKKQKKKKKKKKVSYVESYPKGYYEREGASSASNSTRKTLSKKRYQEFGDASVRLSKGAKNSRFKKALDTQ